MVGQEGPTGVSDGNRGVFAGGKAPSASDTIEFVAITVAGNATDFAGELTTEALQRKGGHSNGARGVFTGGSPPTRDHIEYITIGTLGDSIDFGELFVASTNFASLTDGSRAIIAGGDPNVGTMHYLNMASLGNTADFGELAESRGAAGGVTNGSRGVIAGGYDTANVDTQEYITIGTLGNSTDSNESSQARQVSNYGNLSGA